MNIDTILKELFAGKSLELDFSTEKEREAFRQRLYKEKQAQDKILGDILDEPKQKLKFQYVDTFKNDVENTLEEVIRAKIWLETRPAAEYTVLTIEDLEDPSNEPSTQVSGSMGEANSQSQQDRTGSGQS